MVTINVQDDEEAFTMTEDNEVTLTEDEIGNLLQATSSEEELSNKLLGKCTGLARRNFFFAETC